LRSDTGFASPSLDGGLEEFFEFIPRRRFSSAFSARSCSFSARSSAISARAAASSDRVSASSLRNTPTSAASSA
jgi:hypothetical protein